MLQDQTGNAIVWHCLDAKGLFVIAGTATKDVGLQPHEVSRVLSAELLQKDT